MFKHTQMTPKIASITSQMKQAVSEASKIYPAPVVSESRVTWASSVTIFVFLGLSVVVLDLCPMYAADRRQTSDRQQTDDRQKHR